MRHIPEKNLKFLPETDKLVKIDQSSLDIYANFKHFAENLFKSIQILSAQITKKTSRNPLKRAKRQ